MRQWLNENTHIAVPAIIAFMLLWMVVLIVRLRGAGDPVIIPATIYFYDQNTQELFEMPATTVGPVETDSGPHNGEPAGVKAHVFACGDCKTGERFIGWLEKPAPELQEGQEVSENDLYTLVRRPDKDEWIKSNTDEAGQLFISPTKRCPDSNKRANYCMPAKRRPD